MKLSLQRPAGEVVDAPDAPANAGRLWAADTGGCEGMGEVKDVRWNKKKGTWKVVARAGEEIVGSAAPRQAAEEVGASAIRESLTLYEETFRDFPHAALLQLAVDSRTQAQADADWAEVQASIDALQNTMPVRGGTTPPSPASAPPLPRVPVYYDQILAISGLVDRELAAMKSREDAPDPRSAAPASGAADAEVAPAVDHDVAAIVQRWAVEHVVRLGLCPYAAGVVDKMRTVAAYTRIAFADCQRAHTRARLLAHRATFSVLALLCACTLCICACECDSYSHAHLHISLHPCIPTCAGRAAAVPPRLTNRRTRSLALPSAGRSLRHQGCRICARAFSGRSGVDEDIRGESSAHDHFGAAQPFRRGLPRVAFFH